MQKLDISIRLKDILAKVSGFLRSSNNPIDWTKTSLNDPIWYAQNVGDMEIKGVEIEMNHQVFNWLKYSAGYTYLDNDFKQQKDLVSRYTLDNLKHQFIGKLETRFLKNFTNEVVYRYNERLNNGSYNLLDEKISFAKKDFSVYVLINNITNTEYTETLV
jgi:iron complex outermembrane receptor protein